MDLWTYCHYLLSVSSIGHRLSVAGESYDDLVAVVISNRRAIGALDRCFEQWLAWGRPAQRVQTRPNPELGEQKRISPQTGRPCRCQTCSIMAQSTRLLSICWRRLAVSWNSDLATYTRARLCSFRLEQTEFITLAREPQVFFFYEVPSSLLSVKALPAICSHRSEFVYLLTTSLFGWLASSVTRYLDQADD